MGAGYSVVLMQNNEIILELYEGASSFNKDTAIPYNRQTLFNLGSTTKPFTSTLLFKLKEEGKLDFHDKVVDYIPEYPFGDVNLSHLMLHTGGYGLESTKGFINSESNPFGKSNNEKYLKAIYSIDKRDFPLGTQSIYFSPGYNILQDVIERLTGMNIESYAQQTLFRPLNMHDTTYDIRTIDQKFYPCPTSFSEKNEVIASEWKDYAPIGEAGMISTCNDLVKFGKMILNKGVFHGRGILNEDTALSLVSEATEGKFNHTRAFFSRGNGKIYPTCFSDDYSSKASGHPGFCGTMFWIEPSLDMTAAFLTNSTTVGEEWYSGTGNLVWQIAKILRKLASTNLG